MKYYTFAHILKDKGFVEVPKTSYEPCNDAKQMWVEKYLEPAIIHAKCGWESVKYVLMRNEVANITEEYVILSGDKNDPMDGRYIDITANSKGAIINAVSDNLW